MFSFSEQEFNDLTATILLFVSELFWGFFSVGTGATNSGIVNCFWFMFISLRRRFTFCPSLLSSIFGIRFRRALSVVDGHFLIDGWLLDLVLLGVVAVTVVEDPNNRNGDMFIGRNSDSSVSVGLPVFAWRRTGLLIGDARLLLLSIESLRGGNNLNDGKLFSNGRTSWPRRKRKKHRIKSK